MDKIGKYRGEKEREKEENILVNFLDFVTLFLPATKTLMMY